MSPAAVVNELEALFPPPSCPPSALAPQRLPGTSVESLAALQHVLQDNHKRWHIFLNDMKFHNHITHRALALYALGGSGSIIRGFYTQDSQRQLPAVESPEAITLTSFADHLGDGRYYKGYVDFFAREIDEKGTSTVLEEYIFSDRFQYQEGASNQPEMLSRFTASLLHALIHVGHGLEFGLKGMVVEGLALAAVQDVDGKDFYPLHFFAENGQVTTEADTHVFDVIARMVRDEDLKVKNVHALIEFKQAVEDHAARIRCYAAQWTVNATKKGEIERKVEELIWLTSALYAIGGFDEVKGFTGEFFLMHMVTSSLFLPSLITSLTPSSQALLLRAYLVTVLTWWVARGRPVLNIKSFMASTSTRPTVPMFKGSDGSGFPKEHPNPFLPIIQSSILNPNDHLPKIQRSFAHFSTVYGNRPAGYHKGTELEGAELLDGSLFVRAALLTANYMREENTWSVNGFF
ncbi:hypothetical protein EDD17DRAFT_1475504 [Pisolithus thermaeus]|nr:hypothetical protein EV401DRAFT_2269464 [Pisolithus croceorrhizus]KAI6163935.1 hypothetical protein EDD17DRAFT_1475504 [Pisolithus thermaeus]